MATTRIMPLHIGKGRTESQAISDIIDYVENPQKTDNGKLITGYGCDSRTPMPNFCWQTAVSPPPGGCVAPDDVIAYHVRQSFKPGEITPEEANRLGVEFARRFTKRAIMPLWSAPTSTSLMSIITSSGRRSMWIVTGSSATFGAAPEPSGD